LNESAGNSADRSIGPRKISTPELASAAARKVWGAQPTAVTGLTVVAPAHPSFLIGIEATSVPDR
jgi:hypothetical protein